MLQLRNHFTGHGSRLFAGTRPCELLLVSEVFSELSSMGNHAHR